ncbi:uncharacterized protein LOC108465678 isoform X1 [Gossypium arboreum]|uniref:uncharacterized protein LOC108465678 isoform X1 n=1 Tax=Gossypium arboreum TaxID=29729 RepID=UPI00081906F1|nr:uncharacterized protein LOC108465678 isoform X1 [Gossypium arboreum]
MVQNEVAFSLGHGFSICRTPYVKSSQKLGEQSLGISRVVEKKPVKKVEKNEHHLWKKRDSAGSGQKALNLVRIVNDSMRLREAHITWLQRFLNVITAQRLVSGVLELSSIFYFVVCHHSGQRLSRGWHKAIIRSAIDFKRDSWPKVSDNAKDLVKKMLNPDPKQRLTVQECFNIHGYKMPKKHPMFHWVRL